MIHKLSNRVDRMKLEIFYVFIILVKESSFQFLFLQPIQNHFFLKPTVNGTISLRATVKLKCGSTYERIGSCF